MKKTVKLMLLVLHAGLCVIAQGASVQGEQGAPGPHISDKIFKDLEARQERIVELWLEAREADEKRRKSLESQAQTLQDELSAGVKRVKSRAQLILDMTRRNHQRALKEANPQLTDQMRRDPRGFVKETIHAEVNSLIEANPFLKETADKVRRIQDFMKEPQLVLDEMEAEFLRQVEDVAKDTDVYKQLNASYQEQRRLFQAAVDRQKQPLDVITRGMATAIDRSMKTAVASQFAKGLMEKTGKPTSSWQIYASSLTDVASDAMQIND